MKSERLEHINKLIEDYRELGEVVKQEIASYKKDFGETIPIHTDDFYSTLATALCGDTPEDFKRIQSCFAFED